jgi:asparagine synthase (glutamine-hydrolysing)
LNTFTAVPEAGFTREELRGRYFDETPYVRQIEEVNPNIFPHFIAESRDPSPKAIADLIRMTGLPLVTLNCLWAVDMFAAVRTAGHDVMLGGDMGNTTMSYHGWGLFTELLQTGRWLRLCTELRSLGYRWRGRFRYQVIAPLIPAPLFRRYKQWRRRGKPAWHDYSLINPDFAVKNRVIDRAARRHIPFDGKVSFRGWKPYRLNDIQTYCEAADWCAKVRANFGIDYRMPAFDRRVFEFCMGIPEDQYLRKGRDRWLIRRAMEGRLPASVLNQQRCGAQSADWYQRLTRERNRIADEVKRLATNPQVASMLDMQRLISILDNWPDSQPVEYTAEEKHLLAVPDALGMAYFIENMTATNYQGLQLS